MMAGVEERKRLTVAKDPRPVFSGCFRVGCYMAEELGMSFPSLCGGGLPRPINDSGTGLALEVTEVLAA